MKVNSVNSLLPKKTVNRLATAVLGAGLLLTAESVKANNNKQNNLTATNNTELSVAKESAEKDTVKGGLIFGGAILTYLGCIALGNKLHDKNNKYLNNKS